MSLGPERAGWQRARQHIEVGTVLDVGVVLESEHVPTILLIDGGRPGGA